MDEFEPIRELRRALDALIDEAEEYRESVSQSGIDPEYWLAYQFDLEEKVAALATARESLEKTYTSPSE